MDSLLASKDVRWLVTNYLATGALSVAATQTLLRWTPLRRRLDLGAIWWYLAVYQAVRLTGFAWRLLRSNVRPRLASPPASSNPSDECSDANASSSVARLDSN